MYIGGEAIGIDPSIYKLIYNSYTKIHNTPKGSRKCLFECLSYAIAHLGKDILPAV